MTHEDFLLNRTWNRFFNLAVILPIVIGLAGILFAILLFTIILGPSISNNDTIVELVLILSITVFALSSLIYLMWFIIKADTLFKFLGMNRMLSNILNILGIFLLLGTSFLVLPVLFYIKINYYWNTKGMCPNWKGVIIN